MSHLTYAEAVVTGLIQGVTELFPVSSLGHNVLLPALIGGQWAKDLSVSAPGSPYLAFIVGLHVATALAMIAYFWRDWLRIVRGFWSSLRRREIVTSDQRLAWMIVLATIPVGIAGAALQTVFTKVFARPELTALFLAANGLVLLYSERQRRARAGAAAGVGAAAGAAVSGGAAVPVSSGSPAASAGGPPPEFWGPDPAQAGAGDGGGRDGGAWHGGAGDGGSRDGGSRDGGAWNGGPAPGGYDGYSQQPWQQQWQQQQWQGPDPWSGQEDWPYSRPGGAAPQAASRTPAAQAADTDRAVAADRRLSRMGYGRAILVGAAQILALLPGISRDGIVTVAGMGRGLSREDAVRFSFLLSAPVILAAGLLKVHDLFGPLGKGIHGPVLVGSLLSFVGAYLSVRFLTKYFSESRSLNPFGIYCLAAGILSFAYLAIR